MTDQMSASELTAVVKPAPRRVPEAYLCAEVAAFPLVSEESFREALVSLDPRFSNDAAAKVQGSSKSCGAKTSSLWRACEKMLSQHTGWSLDRLVNARDLGWFGHTPNRKQIRMCEYLRNLAKDQFLPRAGVTEVKPNEDISSLDSVDRYRWLTFALPEDLLLAGLGVDPPPVRVDIDPPLLSRRLLDIGVAEIHQHIGAGMNFSLLWASALAALATPGIKRDLLASPGSPFGEGKDLIRWLLAAVIARCTLAEFLMRGGHDGFSGFLEQFISHNTDVGSWTPRRRETLKAALSALCQGRDELLPEIEPLRDLYADIHPSAQTLSDCPVKSIEDAYHRCDPIAARLGLHGDNVGERWFLRKSLEYLNDGSCVSTNDASTSMKREDPLFAKVFWQTARLRCQYFRAVVERPLTGGLQWFLRFYGRLGALRKPIYPILPEASFFVAGNGQAIRALELRKGLDGTAIEIGETLLSYLFSWQRVLRKTSNSPFDPEFGLVYHFKKERDSRHAWEKGVPAAYWTDTNAEPFKGFADVDHGRFVGYFAGQSRRAKALADFIKAVPASLWVIRGLDVATDELAVPTWVLVPLFRYVLDVSASVSVLDQTDFRSPPPLRATAHVGEDFRHLMEGLRRIYEQIHYVLGSSGGRLGHALALGVEPQFWAESANLVLMPAEERLWDLVFEWRLYSKYRINLEYAAAPPPGRIESIKNQVNRLSALIFGKAEYKIEELAEAHHLLHRILVPPYSAEAEAVDGGKDVFIKAAERLRYFRSGKLVRSSVKVSKIIEKYFQYESVFQRGQTLIEIPLCQNEVAALQAIQYALRRGITQKGIVVEVNPSSNLLIGDMLDMRNHPILRLSSPVPDPDGPPQTPIAIGSDDPITFETRLLREYSVLHQAACAAGYPERTVQSWLESVCRTGMDARFTLTWSPSAEDKVESLIDVVEQFLHKPYLYKQKIKTSARRYGNGADYCPFMH